MHDLTFIRDVLGNVSGSTDAEGAHSYTYDKLGQLATVTHGQPTLQPNEYYTYDAVGNRLTSHLSSTYLYSYMGTAGNRLTQNQQFTYDYDNEGNLIQITDRGTGAKTSLSFDHRNRVTGIQSADSVIPNNSVHYTYDLANRRILALENGATSSYSYEGQNPVLRLTASGSIDSRRLYSFTLDDVLADDSNLQARFFLRDQNGTSRDLVGPSAGVANHYTYDSFGRLPGQSHPDAKNDLLFTGREYSFATRLFYNRARLFDPSNGRFYSEDALFPFRYVYALNNPLVISDPLGQSELGDLLNTVTKIVQGYAKRDKIKKVCAGVIIGVKIVTTVLSPGDYDPSKALLDFDSARRRAYQEAAKECFK